MHMDVTTLRNDIQQRKDDAIQEADEYMADSPNEKCRQLAFCANVLVGEICGLADKMLVCLESDEEGVLRFLRLKSYVAAAKSIEDEVVFLYNEWEQEYRNWETSTS